MKTKNGIHGDKKQVAKRIAYLDARSDQAKKQYRVGGRFAKKVTEQVSIKPIFKVGDRVEVVRPISDNKYIEIGMQGEIVRIRQSNVSPGYTVRFDSEIEKGWVYGEYRNCWSCWATELKLVTEPKEEPKPSSEAIGRCYFCGAYKRTSKLISQDIAGEIGRKLVCLDHLAAIDSPSGLKLAKVI